MTSVAIYVRAMMAMTVRPLVDRAVSGGLQVE